jgi:arsenate reductase (glutaredoxin)
MADVTIFHNTSCSKSRGALQILEERGVEHDVVLYKQTPPDRATLERIVDLVDAPPSDLVRRDPLFKELGLSDADVETKEQVVGVLAEHPELMQRPIVIRGDRAVIGRPPENIEALLSL